MRSNRKAKAGARAPRLDIKRAELALKDGGTASVPMASAGSLGELAGIGEDEMREGLESLVAEGKLVAVETEDGAIAFMSPKEAGRYARKPVPVEELRGEEPAPMDADAFNAALMAEVKEGVRSGALVLVRPAVGGEPPLAMLAKDFAGEGVLVPLEELDSVDVVAFTVADLVAWGLLVPVRERDGSLGMRFPADAMEEGLEPLPWTPELEAKLSEQCGDGEE